MRARFRPPQKEQKPTVQQHRGLRRAHHLDIQVLPTARTVVMSEFYPKPARKSSPFIVTPYLVDATAGLSASMPTRCPAGAVGAKSACRLRRHGSRQRKTGPQCPVAIVRCQTHGRSFTLYPPGFAPYARQLLVPLAPDGEQISVADEIAVFDDTPFEAAIDAKSGRAWARESDESPALPPDRWWSTQNRHLVRAARLLGVSHGLSDTVRGKIAAVLSLSTLFLREQVVTRGYRAIGDAVCSVLALLRRGRQAANDLLVCAHLAGQCGEPFFWDARRQVLRQSPFLEAGTNPQE